MLLRPYALVIAGQLETGLELLLDGDRIIEIRPHTGLPDPYVISPAFVNAHSHLEYRHMLGVIDAPDYLPWIRELTRLKTLETEKQVSESCLLAARENRATGVAWIGEHSDRPFAGEALRANGIGGTIFQEVITFFQREKRHEVLLQSNVRASRNQAAFQGPVFLSPHAFHTVDPDSLRELGDGDTPRSIHVAETCLERELIRSRTGPLADPWRVDGLSEFPIGISIVEALQLVGLVRRNVQFVHACDIDDHDMKIMAEGGVSVAHCPRSNTRLKSPIAPIRRLLSLGIRVGLGLDSAASSGPIDMFEEMREASRLSYELGEPLQDRDIWLMATRDGYGSFGDTDQRAWDIIAGSNVPLIKIHIPDALCTADLIERGDPRAVEWVA